MVQFAKVKNQDGFDGAFFEPGMYLLKLLEIDEPEQQFYPETHTYVWKFEVYDPTDTSTPVMIPGKDGEPDKAATLWAFVGDSMGPKAKQRKYIEALLGRTLTPEDEISDSDIIGKTMQATLNEKKNDKTGKWSNTIESVLPYNPSAKRGRRVATKTDESAGTNGEEF